MAEYFYREAKAEAGAPLLLVFHGTGGDENQFFDLGQQFLPGGRVIAPRGDVSEGGALRYFRRTGEGRYDMADLALRTTQMAAFIKARVAETKPSRVIGLGYSNGANILASVQFSAPALFDATVLMHPLIPFQPPAAPGLEGRHVLVTAGRRDPIAPAPASQQLVDYFTDQGASASLFWHDGGHELRPEEVHATQRFIASIGTGA
ncbi:MAG TPA: alpha/beta hydrolase [Devosia sp.]|nr:alpha/beta hydrolase [Devosia sp.]